jgi:3-oxoacyl-[acyl-carrier-protein] synthase-1
MVNGEALPVAEAAAGGPFLTALYRSLKIDYPKFFKMDALSKLGFLASELILRDEHPRFTPREDVAVICFNRSASLATDTQYQSTIRAGESCYPSPSVFVYTLPNIVTGEIAIRNKFFGETSFYVCREWNAQQALRTVSHALCEEPTRAVLAAWVECFEETCEAFMMLVDTQSQPGVPPEKILNFKSGVKHQEIEKAAKATGLASIAP